MEPKDGLYFDDRANLEHLTVSKKNGNSVFQFFPKTSLKAKPFSIVKMTFPSALGKSTRNRRAYQGQSSL